MEGQTISSGFGKAVQIVVPLEQEPLLIKLKLKMQQEQERKVLKPELVEYVFNLGLQALAQELESK
ncbi:MAG: hypothetical protein HC874_14155 [Richelia sp. SL_2_1]|nr:hypothetical protein [Richelia sp. SL_2_1]